MATTHSTKPAVPASQDSLKSTWRTWDHSQWNLFHWTIELFRLHGQSLNKDQVPVHQKTDTVPFVPQWQMHKWIIVHSSIPLLLHQAYIHYTGHNFGPIAAFFFYSLCFKLSAIHQIHMLRYLGSKFGFLDGDKHERDGVPDARVFRVLAALISTVFGREMMCVMLAYRTNKAPSSIDLLMLPLEIGLYSITLDFWFYWYHRAMHVSDTLWKHHRTHHMTKHPSTLLTLYADGEQELLDIIGIPLLTYVTLKLVGFPMGFYELWFCHQYVVFSELKGHSGIRVMAQAPSPNTWFLKYFGAELCIEDHDLHHRKGWKKSHNYGKQTRLWDRVFGTCADRIECTPENIDYDNPVSMPFFFL